MLSPASNESRASGRCSFLLLAFVLWTQSVSWDSCSPRLFQLIEFHERVVYCYYLLGFFLFLLLLQTHSFFFLFSLLLISGSSGASPERSDDSEEDQWSLWGRLVADWSNVYKKRNSYIKELVRKGVPHHFRGVVWPLLCSSAAIDSPAKSQYADYIKATSACEKVIRRDIARTYPEHDFFKEKDGLGQESLFNVMKAYSLHDREVGYCQGSAFIVGILLMQVYIKTKTRRGQETAKGGEVVSIHHRDWTYSNKGIIIAAAFFIRKQDGNKKKKKRV